MHILCRFLHEYIVFIIAYVNSPIKISNIYY